MSNYLTKGIVANALNMPSVSADVAPRLEPFIELAEHLGTFVGQLANRTIDSIEIEYVGDETQLGKESLTAAVLAGALSLFWTESIWCPLLAAPKKRVLRLARMSKAERAVLMKTIFAFPFTRRGRFILSLARFFLTASRVSFKLRELIWKPNSRALCYT